MVVIKNFEIPDNCLFCKCYQDDRCVFLNEWNCVSGIKRLDNCPLETHVTCKNCMPPVQAVPISELKNLREEMGNITDIKTYHERNLIWTCLCMLDNLIESYEEESAD